MPALRDPCEVLVRNRAPRAFDSQHTVGRVKHSRFRMIMTRARRSGLMACATLAALFLAANARATRAGNTQPTTRALLNHARRSGSGDYDGWTWSWGFSGGADDYSFLSFPFVSTPTPMPSASATRDDDSVSAFASPSPPNSDPSSSFLDDDAYNANLSARIEAAVVDIFLSFLRIFSLAFEPLWRAMSLDLGLGWISPPSVVPAWRANTAWGNNAPSDWFQGETEEGDTILAGPGDVTETSTAMEANAASGMEVTGDETVPTEEATSSSGDDGGGSQEEAALGNGVQDISTADVSSPFQLYSAFMRRDKRL